MSSVQYLLTRGDVFKRYYCNHPTVVNNTTTNTTNTDNTDNTNNSTAAVSAVSIDSVYIYLDYNDATPYGTLYCNRYNPHSRLLDRSQYNSLLSIPLHTLIEVRTGAAQSIPLSTVIQAESIDAGNCFSLYTNNAGIELHLLATDNNTFQDWCEGIQQLLTAEPKSAITTTTNINTDIVDTARTTDLNHSIAILIKPTKFLLFTAANTAVDIELYYNEQQQKLIFTYINTDTDNDSNINTAISISELSAVWIDKQSTILSQSSIAALIPETDCFTLLVQSNNHSDSSEWISLSALNFQQRAEWLTALQRLIEIQFKRRIEYNSQNKQFNCIIS